MANKTEIEETATELGALKIEIARPSRGIPHIKDKINATTFPVILSKVMLNGNIPPTPPKQDEIWKYTQLLCILCLEKPATRKRVYHMFIPTGDVQIDVYERVKKKYENRKDIKIVGQLTECTLCARTLCRRIQKMFKNAKWNKSRNIFELDMDADADVSDVSRRLNAIRKEEEEKLLKYIMYSSVT
ncbi:hypothetical protein KR009_000670 [Drosophila setifemur]|nr:hypothetical protein KR009_000670 [Drosophila setifemur]